MEKVIEVKNLKKTFGIGTERQEVLKGIDLTINKGDFVIIMGKSGSGKTTLLNILSLISNFSGGEYFFYGENITTRGEKKKSKLRNKYLGFVFQQFLLIESISVRMNIELPLLYGNNLSLSKREERIDRYLNEVGLLEKKYNFPKELSGGQQQRISIARAIINNPDIIFADEPTGALDSVTSNDIMQILKSLNNEEKTIIMVTHDQELKGFANKVVYIKDGTIERIEQV